MKALALWLYLLSQMFLTAGQQYLGPYKEIYPYVDITRDQQSCVPDPAAGANGTCPLYIALMMSFGGDFVSSGVIPGVQLAINQINSDPSILPGYTLHYTLLDTQVAMYVNSKLQLSMLTLQLNLEAFNIVTNIIFGYYNNIAALYSFTDHHY